MGVGESEKCVVWEQGQYVSMVEFRKISVSSRSEQACCTVHRWPGNVVFVFSWPFVTAGFPSALKM